MEYGNRECLPAEEDMPDYNVHSAPVHEGKKQRIMCKSVKYEPTSTYRERRKNTGNCRHMYIKHTQMQSMPSL